LIQSLWNRLRVYLAALVLGGAGFTGAVLVHEAQQPKKETVLLLRGLSHYHPSGWPMVELKRALEKEGYSVTIGNHTDGDELRKLPDILIGHSMGGNAALKAVNRFVYACDALTSKKDERLACYKRSLPRHVISLDAGKVPLYSRGPTHGATKCTSFWGPRLLIGGQPISACTNYKMKDTDHGTFPQTPKVISGIIRILNSDRPTLPSR
jgi:hypothetical protein